MQTKKKILAAIERCKADQVKHMDKLVRARSAKAMSFHGGMARDLAYAAAMLREQLSQAK